MTSLKYKLMLKLLDISETYYVIQRLNSYNLRLAKWLKKSLEKFTDQMKKAKKVPVSWKSTFHKGQYLKPSNINLASVSEHVRKILWNLLTQLIQFTDQQIYLKNFYIC